MSAQAVILYPARSKYINKGYSNDQICYINVGLIVICINLTLSKNSSIPYNLCHTN